MDDLLSVHLSTREYTGSLERTNLAHKFLRFEGVQQYGLIVKLAVTVEEKFNIT